MKKYALEIAYDGTQYRGWQSQPGGGTIQDALEGALRSLGEPGIRVDGAGRTDAGVHARAQTGSVSLSKDWEPRRLLLALNAKLPPTISVMRAAAAQDTFHARKSAVTREYRYFIWNAPTCFPHIRPYVFWLPGAHYDWTAARAAVPFLVGRHDFSAFCRKEDCPANSVRNVRYARLFRKGPLLVFRIVADAYLTNMIRIAVGNLLAVAAGRRQADWFRSLLESPSDRTASGQTAPPCGLFFWRVEYGDDSPWR